MMTVEDKLCEIIDIKELEIEAQQKEIEQLNGRLKELINIFPF